MRAKPGGNYNAVRADHLLTTVPSAYLAKRPWERSWAGADVFHGHLPKPSEVW